MLGNAGDNNAGASAPARATAKAASPVAQEPFAAPAEEEIKIEDIPF